MRTLKQLLDEVEKARKPLVRSPEKIIGDAVRYESELMPDLARRLEVVVNGLKSFCPQPADSRCLCRCPACVILHAIKTPPKPYVPPYVPVAQDSPQRCPKCTYTMIRSEKSSGWYCRGDALFIPDDCVQ